MRTNHIALVAGYHQPVESLVHEHVEVIAPEVGHHFFKLALAVDGAQKFHLGQFAGHHARRVVHGKQGFLLFRGQAFEKLLPFAPA